MEIRLKHKTVIISKSKTSKLDIRLKHTEMSNKMIKGK